MRAIPNLRLASAALSVLALAAACSDSTPPPMAPEFSVAIPLGSIGDRVWNDADGDGVQDAGEAGLSGWTVTITGPYGYAASMPTGANGIYTFGDLFEGAYTVCVTPAAGYTQTYDLDGLGTPNCAVRTIAEGEAATDVDFGYMQPPPGVCVGLTPGYWKNWKNHYTQAQFLTLLAGTIADGDVKLAGKILSTNTPSLYRLRKFVLANQLTLNLTGTGLPNPSGGNLTGTCSLSDGTALSATLAKALLMLKGGYSSAEMDAIGTILDIFANLGGG